MCFISGGRPERNLDALLARCDELRTEKLQAWRGKIVESRRADLPEEHAGSLMNAPEPNFQFSAPSVRLRK